MNERHQTKKGNGLNNVQSSSDCKKEEKIRECPDCESDMTWIKDRDGGSTFDWLCTNPECRRTIDEHPRLRKAYRAVWKEKSESNFHPYGFRYRVKYRDRREDGKPCDEIVLTYRNERVDFEDIDRYVKAAEKATEIKFTQILREDRYLRVRIVIDRESEEERLGH
jgi:hypothetical protein